MSRSDLKNVYWYGNLSPVGILSRSSRTAEHITKKSYRYKIMLKGEISLIQHAYSIYFVSDEWNIHRIYIYIYISCRYSTWDPRFVRWAAVRSPGATTHQTDEAFCSRDRHRKCSRLLVSIAGQSDTRRFRRPSTPRSAKLLADADCLSTSGTTHSAPSVPSEPCVQNWGSHVFAHGGKSISRSTRSWPAMNRAADEKSKLWDRAVPRPRW